MDKYIEQALANQVYDLVSRNRSNPQLGLFVQTKDGIKKDDVIDGIDLIKHIMQSRVSPLTIIRRDDEFKPLISAVFSMTKDNDILDIFIDVIKKEHIDNLDNRTILRMYNSLDTEDYSKSSEKFLKKIFELGFDFQQGTFGEVSKAQEGNQSFFELCMIHKPDFRFDFKYNDRAYLDEFVEHKLTSLNKGDPEYKKIENTMIFLQTSRKVYELKKSLDVELPSNEVVKNNNRPKI